MNCRFPHCIGGAKSFLFSPPLCYLLPVQPTSRDVRRRWFGAFFLAVAAGMVIWGQTVLAPYLHGAGYLVYWLVCATFTLLAIATALLDLVVLRRRTRSEQRDLFRRTFDPPDGGGTNDPRSNEKNSHG